MGSEIYKSWKHRRFLERHSMRLYVRFAKPCLKFMKERHSGIRYVVRSGKDFNIYSSTLRYEIVNHRFVIRRGCIGQRYA